MTDDAAPPPSGPPEEAPPPVKTPPRRRPLLAKLGRVARGAGLLAAGAGGVYIFHFATKEHYPLKHWLFWVYAELWAYAALFTLACFSAGHLIVSRLRLPGIPLRERLVMITTTGVLAFFYAMFVGGLLGLLHSWFAIAMPLVLIAAGARGVWRDGRRVYRHVRARRDRGVRPRSPLRWPVIAFGVVCVALVYYGILSPRNIAFDSHFYHLGIAQQYATDHAIRSFKEGWLPGALPHLASVLYTWVFCLPGLDMFGRIVGAGHIEFVLFLLTIAQIPVLVRYLAPKADASFSWVAMFLFPGLFVYDSGLSAAADHVTAFWAIPSYLAFRRAYRELEPKACAVLAACLSGAILTKYQAMYILAFPVAALSFRAAWLIGRPLVSDLRAKRRVQPKQLLAPLYGLGAALVAGLVFTSAHWLKNLVFYQNPLFPYLANVFPATGWVPDTARLTADWNQWQGKQWVTQGTTKDKLYEAAKATFTFSFSPHDWKNFHGKVPVFGSLFTLCTALLPFLKGTRRVWALSAATHLGVFVWFYTFHQDRYLQALLPWMAATTAAALALAWRAGVPGKVAAGALVGFQLIWGGDAFLIPASAMTKAAPITVSNELVAMGYKKKYEQRFKVSGTLFDIGASPELPADARILLHENNPRLGLWRPVVVDVAGWQFGMRYELFATPGALDDKLRSLGITHIVSRSKKSRETDCLGADLRFFDYVEQEAQPLRRFGEFALYAMPAARPESTAADQVAYLGCGRLYERGIHDLSALHVRDKQVQVKPAKRRAKKKGDAEVLLAEADFAVTDPSCKPAVGASSMGAFLKIGKRAKEELWARKRSELERADAPEPSGSDPIDEGENLIPE